MPVQKLYISGLRAVLGQAHRYGTRYQSKLAVNLTEAQYNCLVDVLAALASCLALLGANPIE